MRRRRRRDGFYPAPDFRDREAEDMAGVFDIDLDQPEDAGSEEELEEGVRPGVRGGLGWRPRGDRPGSPAGLRAWRPGEVLDEWREASVQGPEPGDLGSKVW